MKKKGFSNRRGDSTYNVQKGYFQSCGEIAAESLAQGGPSPCVLQGCVYESMVNPETDFKSLNVEHIIAEEKISNMTWITIVTQL